MIAHAVRGPAEMWQQESRSIRHITTGLYLGVKEDSMDLCLMSK